MINMAGYDNLAIFGAVVVGLLWFQPCTTVLFCKRYDIFSHVTSTQVLGVSVSVRGKYTMPSFCSVFPFENLSYQYLFNF